MLQFDKETGKEIFNKRDQISALKAFIDYGEQSFDRDREFGSGDKSHGGYFSGSGYAARALRSLYEEMKATEEQEKGAKEKFDEKYMKDWDELLGQPITINLLLQIAGRAWRLGFNDCKERNNL